MQVEKKEPTPEKKEVDAINTLIEELGGLSLNEEKYLTRYAQLCVIAPQISELFAKPHNAQRRSYAVKETRFEHNEAMRRDSPPHMSPPPFSQRFGKRREVTCFGCGDRVHRMD